MTIKEHMGKDDIDAQAEREANALKKQGRYNNQQNRRNRQSSNYNTMTFNKLFKN